MKTDAKDYTFRRIRRAVGYLGISLPIFLLISSSIPFFKTTIQPSISHYYYTNFRDVFVGILCAVSLFLVRYKGHRNDVIWKNDNFITNLAGVMALGIAFFPVNPEMECHRVYTLIPYSWKWIGTLHFIFAGCFFSLTALLSISVFTIGQNQLNDITKSFFNENNIYRICGYSIVLFMVMIPICSHFQLFKNSTFIFETLCLFAFGIAWLIKGRALGDKGIIGEKVYREYNSEHTERQ